MNLINKKNFKQSEKICKPIKIKKKKFWFKFYFLFTYTHAYISIVIRNYYTDV